MLTGKQKRYLRSQAHHLQPIFQVGKGGTNDQVIRHISEALERRELIKVSILNNNLDDPQEIAAELAEGQAQSWCSLSAGRSCCTRNLGNINKSSCHKPDREG